MASFDEDTVDFEVEKTFAEQFFAPNVPQFKLRPAAATHVGKVRHRNEDHHAVIRHSRSREILFTNLPKESLTFPEDEVYGMVVADGIGGAAAGDVASQLAVMTMLELASRATSWVMRVTDLDAQEIHKRVEAYVLEIQNTLRSYSKSDSKLAGMGTTWTSVHVLVPDAIVVQIGDSRAYLYRDTELLLITRDQTLGQEMADAGMPEEDVRRFHNILTNSFGGDANDVQAEVYQIEIQAGDRLLLCTDGLSDMIADSVIANVLARQLEPQAACDQLIQRALDAGGKDNITVVVCDITAAEATTNE